MYSSVSANLQRERREKRASETAISACGVRRHAAATSGRRGALLHCCVSSMLPRSCCSLRHRLQPPSLAAAPPWHRQPLRHRRPTFGRWRPGGGGGCGRKRRSPRVLQLRCTAGGRVQAASSIPRLAWHAPQGRERRQQLLRPVHMRGLPHARPLPAHASGWVRIRQSAGAMRTHWTSSRSKTLVEYSYCTAAVTQRAWRPAARVARRGARRAAAAREPTRAEGAAAVAAKEAVAIMVTAAARVQHRERGGGRPGRLQRGGGGGEPAGQARLDATLLGPAFALHSIGCCSRLLHRPTDAHASRPGLARALPLLASECPARSCSSARLLAA